uniref:Calx-beta domain-containing protein n=1 Tax=Phytophthora ramorum TaxID=164328 RepID=H3H2V4_PHYRM
MSLRFSSKTYNVLEGDSFDVTVQRCSRFGGFCAVDVSAAPQLYVEYDTGDAFSDRQSKLTKLSSLDADGSSASVFFAENLTGQEPFPQVGNGRWLTADSVGTANGRNQFYGSSERRSLWVDTLFDYAGTCDYASSSGELYFDGVDDLSHTFTVQTTSDFVVENPDETVMMRLSLPDCAPGMRFGTSVAIDGSLGPVRVIVGAPGADAADRVQYQVLERTVEQAYAFGHALDMDRRTIIVGAPFSDAGTFTAQQYHSAGFDHRFFGKGAAYVFHLEAQEQRITLRTSNPLTSGSFRLTATRRGISGITRAISYSAATADVKAALEGTNGQDGDGSTIEALGFKLLEVGRASAPGQRANHEGRYWVGTFESRPGAGKATTAAQVAAQMCAFANDELCRAPNYKLPSASASAGTSQGDSPQGTLTSLPFTIEGQWMSFRVGGGCDVRVVYVELLIDGQPAAVSESVAAEQVAVEVTADGTTTTSADSIRPVTATSKLRATGRCQESMNEVTWDLSAFQNRSAQIRVVDASSSPVWGHINFDDVRFSWGATRVAQTSTSRAGAAYAFRRRAPGTGFPTAKCEGMSRWTCEWEFQARLAASDKRSEDLFGSSVAVDDVLGVAVVAAPGQRGLDANNSIDRVLSVGLDVGHEGLGAMEEVGSIYVFRRSDEVRDGAGVLLRTPKWAPKEVLKMQYPQKQRQSHFGAALDLDGSDLIVGAPGISTSPILPQSGRAFAYDLSVAGVKFTNPWFSCVEGNADGLVGLTLSRPVTTSNLTRPLTIGYATEDRSAVGVDALKFAACMKVPSTQRKDCGDYQQAAGEVTFAAGEMSKLVTIPIMEDNCLEQWEKHFVVRLHVPGGEPLLGEDFIARVRIDDDDFNSDPC